MKHAPHALGVDYALCGVTLDGDPTVKDRDGQLPRLSKSSEFVECAECREIIKHCKVRFDKHMRHLS